MLKRICKKCGHEVTKSEIEGYPYQCKNCDEDLYRFETKVIEDDEKGKEKYTELYFEKHIIKGGFPLLKNMCQHVLLRPNDNKNCFGENGFNNLKKVCERLLENYRDTEFYIYYYQLPILQYRGLCTFERWKMGFLE